MEEVKAKLSPDMTLSSGRTVYHRPYGEGAQEVIPYDGPSELTDEEWSEYCKRLREERHAS